MTYIFNHNNEISVINLMKINVLQSIKNGLFFNIYCDSAETRKINNTEEP